MHPLLLFKTFILFQFVDLNNGLAYPVDSITVVFAYMHIT